MTIGKKATATTVVDETNTAIALGTGNLPVFSTPSMLALIEKAACEILKADIAPSQMCLGVSSNIRHTEISYLGAKLTVTVEVIGVDGSNISFAASVMDDDSGKLVGKGTHSRTIVHTEKVMKKSKRS